MAARKRFEENEGKEFAHLLDRAFAVLTTEKESLAKDFHLIQSALASGQLIVSIESRFPQIVSVASKAVPEFTLLYFANPAVERDACIQWINDGAEKDALRRIDAWAESHRGRN